MKIAATNRKARRDYNIEESFEAGIALRGNEVKSLRVRNCSLDDSFARVEGSQVYLYNMHIPEFEKSSYFKTEPKRTRKLLLHKKEIKRLIGLTTQKGYTLIPLKVYFSSRGLVKVELAVAKGRHVYDKRRKLRDEIQEKEVQRAMKRYRQ